MVKYENIKLIKLNDWNTLVSETYGRPYNFQQQEGCKDRGIFRFSLPNEETYDDEMNDDIPEEINGEIMGVKFKKWLERDPNQPINDRSDLWGITIWWERNFYPDFYTLLNDMYEKKLIKKGDYIIDIDW
jgi:hypothetical protein